MEANFVLKNSSQLGEEDPFLAPQKTNRYSFLVIPEQPEVALA
jgi:hypothetical protein